jgi:uncharacterized membrane protein (DUF2068 family)
VDPVLIKLFLEQATAKGSRSTVLKPLYVMMAVCISGVFASFHFSFPPWSSYFFAFFTFVTMSIYLVSFVYCLAKHPDALRSETYSIQKLAIQKGFVGDNITGVVPIERSVGGNLIDKSTVVDSGEVK